MDEKTKEICLRKITVTDQNAEDPEVTEKAEKLDELCFDLQQYEEDLNINLSKEYMHDLMEVIEQNIFRVLPSCQVENEHVNLSPQFGPSVCNVDDPQMKLLNSVYLLLESLVKTLKNSAVLPLCISESFTTRLFSILFESQDDLERKMICSNLENIYTHLECRAKQINDLLIQSLMELLSKKEVVYSCADTLLYLQLFIITNEDNPKYLPDINTLFRVLTKLHRLHYLFNFYKHLISCCLLLLEKHPSHIVSYTNNVLQIFIKKSVQTSISFMTTKRTLCLIELKHILQLLLRLIKEAKDKSTMAKYEAYFGQLIKPIVDFSLPNLKSNSLTLTVMTIKMLSATEYRKYFRNHPEIVQKVLPLMQNDPHFIDWHEGAYAKQSLYRATLMMDNESDE